MPDEYVAIVVKSNKIGHPYSISFEKKTGRYIRLQVNNAGVLPKFSEIQVYRRDGNQ
jgi:hypothetical protein